MNTHYIDPHEFRDIKRDELLDRIDQNWTIRLKGTECGWNKSGSLTSYIPLKDLLNGRWEGRPPVPTLVKRKHKYYLADVISHVQQTPNSYFRNVDWPEGRFIKWDFTNEIFVHVFDYPKVDTDAHVSFSGDMFNKATYEIWLEDTK